MNRAIWLGATSILSFCFSFAAASAEEAQDQVATPPSGDRALEPNDQDQIIIVEARRRDEVSQDVPLTVNAVTSDTIEKLNLRNFQDLTSVVPGLSLTPNANGIGSSSSMRGVNQEVNVSGENGTIQFYFFDAPVGSNFVLQAMYDIGQVEVLRGPQGTLRGRATPSGSITVAPRRPDLQEAGATILGTVASDSTTNFQFGINVPIIENKLAVRIAGLADRSRGSRIRSINSSIEPRSQTESIRATVRAEPTDWLRGSFVYQSLLANSRQFDQVQSFDTLASGFTPGVDVNVPRGTIFLPGSGTFPSPRGNYGTIRPDDRTSIETAPRTVRQKFKFYGWNASVDVAGQSLIYVGSRLESNFSNATNQDQGQTFPSLRLFQDGSTVSHGTSHELRLQNIESVAGLFDYVVGYFRQSGSGAEITLNQSSALRLYAQVPGTSLYTTLPAPLPSGVIGSFTPIYSPARPNREESFFGNVAVHLGDKLDLTGGLRRLKFKNESDGLFVSCTPAAYEAGSCRVANGSENDFRVSKTIYNATARYKATPDLMVYASTGTSFRPPVRAVGDFSTAPTPLEISHINLDAETSTSYEIGLKSQWLDRKVTFNLTGYRQDFKNYPYRSASGIYFVNVNGFGQTERSQFNFVSAVPVRVMGLESEIIFRPSRVFSIAAITNYAHSKIKPSQLACTDVNRDGIADVNVPTLSDLQAAYGAEHIAECGSTGQSATFLPRLSGSVQSEVTLPVSDRFDGYVRGLVNWRGKATIDPSNPYDNVGAYALVNLFAGVRGSNGNWEITAFVKNVFDLTKVTSAEASPYNTSVTYVNVGTQRPFGSASYQSGYSGVTVTQPREFGVTARISLGSR